MAGGDVAAGGTAGEGPAASYRFEPLARRHGAAVAAIFNHYVLHSTAAFPTQPVDEDFVGHLLPGPDIRCSYAICAADGEVAGFCVLEPFSGSPAFVRAAEAMYFLAPQHTGRGAGRLALAKLEAEAAARGIRTLTADVADDNAESIAFHKKHGFKEYGRLEDVGEKFGRAFGIVYLHKRIG